MPETEKFKVHIYESKQTGEWLLKLKVENDTCPAFLWWDFLNKSGNGI